jgi:two-component system, NarL family, sensor histidine kinase DegS
MHVNFDTDAGHSLNRFSRLGTWYVLALSVIATVAIIGQVLIQRHLKNQLSDSRVVNVAGKQRMLSQKIAKTVLLLRFDQTETERKEIVNDLRNSVSLWKVSQEGLLQGSDSLRLPGKNSATIDTLFAVVAVDFEKMHTNAMQIISALQHNLTTPYDSLKPNVQGILEHENRFLTGMESIVLQYSNEAQGKVSYLSTMEYIVLTISLLVIAVEIIFIFRPTALQVNMTVNKLIDSEKNAMKLSKEIGALYTSLEKSYEQLSIVNQPVDNPRLYAKSDRGGNVIFVSDAFADLSGLKKISDTTRLCDLFQEMDNPNDWMDEVVETVSERNMWQGELYFKVANQKDCWADITITPVYNEQNEVDELLVLGIDITNRKAAEENMTLKNRAEIEKKINQQKFRSVLILEGQEEERKRIAMDIHDGIGQMLTSLKYQIESIDLKEGERAEQKIKEVDQLIKRVIKEVRKVTFNLKPTVLGDYGLQPALNVFIQEIGKLIDIQLIYKTEGEVERLPQKVENNIFRIIQEAINNAIKYSEANAIEIILIASDSNLTIQVNDKGKGFDIRMVEARSTNIESGRGFFNMYERTEYVNGHLEINSAPGEGTSVVLTVPLHVGIAVE